MESLGLQLSNIPVDLILNILNIVLLFLIVRKLAYKPIRNFMDARTARVTAEAEAAEKKAAEADAAKAKYEAMLQNSEAECAARKEAARQKAQADADKIVADAKAQAAVIVADAQKKAQQEHDDAMQNMQQDVLDLAFDISEKLLEHSVRDADTKKMADRLFNSRLGGGEKA